MTEMDPADRSIASSAQANIASDAGAARTGDGRRPTVITRLSSLAEQVGEHVIRALQQDDTVAVLTTVVPGEEGGQYIASVTLDAELMQQVQSLLEQAETESASRVPCVGFHCSWPRKSSDKSDTSPEQ